MTCPAKTWLDWINWTYNEVQWEWRSGKVKVRDGSPLVHCKNYSITWASTYSKLVWSIATGYFAKMNSDRFKLDRTWNYPDHKQTSPASHWQVKSLSPKNTCYWSTMGAGLCCIVVHNPLPLCRFTSLFRKVNGMEDTSNRHHIWVSIPNAPKFSGSYVVCIYSISLTLSKLHFGCHCWAANYDLGNDTVF